MGKSLKKNKTIAQDIFELRPTKSQMTQMKIIEIALRLFARQGIEKTTYSELSKACGISRPLIHHYFPDLDSLFLAVAKYARATLLRLANEDMSDTNNAIKNLKAYIEGCFRWVIEFEDQCGFWMLYFYQSSRKGEARDENTTMVTAGHRRIQDIIKAGIAEGTFHAAPTDTENLAKAIQIIITGGIVSATTEDGFLTAKKAKAIVTESSLSLLGFKG